MFLSCTLRVGIIIIIIFIFVFVIVVTSRTHTYTHPWHLINVIILDVKTKIKREQYYLI